MASPAVVSLPDSVSVLDPIPWGDQVAEALERALLEYAAIDMQIRRFGPAGLILAREQAERRINGLSGQLTELRMGVPS